MKKISTNEARHTLPIVGQGETTDLGVRIYSLSNVHNVNGSGDSGYQAKRLISY